MRQTWSKILSLSLASLFLVACSPTDDTNGTTTTTHPSQESSEQTTESADDNTTTEPSSETPEDTSEATTTEATTTEATTTEATTTEPTEPENPYLRNIPQPTTWTATLDDANYNLSSIDNVRMVELITGDGSRNMTRTRFRVGGTDLGVPVVHNDLLYLWFGDSFHGDSQGNPMAGGAWRSNVLAISEDTDFADGLDIDDMVGIASGDHKYATELIPSLKSPGNETTVIPTGSVSVNGLMYTYFMSVREWGPPGQWDINYGGLAVSTDESAESFTKVDGFELDPDRFGQVAPIVIGDYIYGVGIGGGRFGDAYLLRVPLDGIADSSQYEYYSGDNSYSPNAEDATAIFDGPVGEPSIMYNAYLEEYVVTYLEEHMASIVMRVASEPTGPWSGPLVIASGRDYPALYGGFVHEYLTAEDGQTFYFIMSQWDPIYNSILFEVEVSR